MKNDSLYDDLPEEETADGSADESAEEDTAALDETEEAEEAEEIDGSEETGGFDGFDGSDEAGDDDEADEAEEDDGTDEELPRKRVRKRRRAMRRNRRKKEKKSMGRKPWIIAGSIVGALLVIYLGVAAFFMSHFLVNTTVNGKDFSGKTAADVEEYLKEQVADYELTILEQNNVSDVIRGTEISLAYKENSQVEDALKEQNQLLWITSLFSRSRASVTIQVEYDESALEERIQNLQAVTAEQTDPVADRKSVV